MSEVAIQIAVNADTGAIDQVTSSLENLKSTVNADSDLMQLLNDKFDALTSTLSTTNAILMDSAIDIRNISDSSQEASTSIGQVEQATAKATDSTKQMSLSLTDMRSGILLVSGVVQGFVGTLTDLMATGEQMQRAGLGLDAISGGHGAQDIAAMTAETKGLVSQLDLAKDASQGLTTGIASGAQDLTHIAEVGAVLGEMSPQIGNAQQGIVAFEGALEHVGMTRPLATLGLDITTVKEEYTALVKEGMDKTAAWEKSLYDAADPLVTKLNPALNDSTTAVDKMTTAFTDLKTELGGEVATTVMQAIDSLSKLEIIGIAVQDRLSKISVPIFENKSGWDNVAEQLVNNTQYGPPKSMMGNYDGGVDTPGGGSYYPNASNQYGPLKGGYSFPPSDLKSAGNFTDSEKQDRQQVRDFESSLAAERQRNQLLSQDADLLFSQQSTLSKSTDELEKQLTLLEHRASIKTEAQAFGLTTDDQLYSSGAQQLQSSEDAYNKSHNINDKTAKGREALEGETQAMNAYLIATGQATSQSLAFDQIHKQLAADAASGKITFAQEADALTNLANGAKDGSLSLNDLNKALALTLNPTGAGFGGETAAQLMNTSDSQHSDANLAGSKGVPGLFDPTKAGGVNAQTDPFAPVKKSANDAHDAVDKMQSLIAKMPDVGDKAFNGLIAQAKNASDFASPIISQAQIAQGQIALIGDALKGLTGNLLISVGFTGASSGGGSGDSLGPIVRTEN